jgi:hypothetical protein
MYGESEKLFTRYFAGYLEKTFSDLISHIDIDVSAEFKKQFVIGSFINTVKWWIENGLTQTPGEIIDSYLKCLKSASH